MLNASQLRSTLQRTLQFDFAAGLGLSSPVGAESTMANSSSNGGAEDKARLLLECRAFSSPSIDAHLCCQLVKRLLALLQQQPQLRSDENSCLFFNLTRLFQSPDCRLRRLVYILLRHLRVAPTEAFVVTSCLAKDVAASSGWSRSCALRAFGDLADGSAAAQLERFIKTALVSPLPQVASAALLCARQLLSAAPEAVRRWAPEVAGAASQQTGAAEAHALSLLLQLRQTDATARRRCLVEGVRQAQEIRQAAGGSCWLVSCVLLRASAAALQQEGDPQQQEFLLRFIEASLTAGPSEEVALEAASAACALYVAGKTRGFSGYSRCASYDPSAALQQLRLLLQSPSAVTRFAAARVLQRLSLHSPSAPTLIARCSSELEALASDSNRTAAALAVSLLLRAAAAGGASGTEKLLQQASALLLDSSDAIRVEVVNAALEMALQQQPSHQAAVVGFLGACLRPEGGLAAKTAATEALMTLLQQRPAAAEACLLQLCEFIEDCEYPGLIGKVLRVLGDEAAAAVASAGAASGSAPEKLLRCIFNRLLLEGAEVRAAGICALAKVARAEERLLLQQQEGQQKQSPPAALSEQQRQRVFLVLSLLKAASEDGDDEVRERAAVFSRALSRSAAAAAVADGSVFSPRSSSSSEEPSLFKSRNGSEQEALSECSTEPPSLDDLLDLRSPVAVECLCEKLQRHLAHPETAALPVDLRDLPSEEAFLKQRQHQQQQQPHQQHVQQTRATAAAVSAASLAGPAEGGAFVGGLHPSAGAGFVCGEAGGVCGDGIPGEDELLQVARALDGSSSAAWCGVSRAVNSVRLTEPEAEYSVECFTHALSASELLLQLRVANTVEEQQLRQVQVVLQPQTGSWLPVAASAIPSLRCGESGNCFVLLRNNVSSADQSGDFEGGLLQAALSFVVSDGEDDAGFEDSYPTEPVAITAAAFLRPLSLRPGEFVKRWAELEAQEEAGAGSWSDSSKLSLPCRSMRAAVDGLLKELQVAPCEGTERLGGGAAGGAGSAESPSHTVLLAGVFGVGAEAAPVLAKARLLLSPQLGGCALLLEAKSRSQEAASALAHALD